MNERAEALADQIAVLLAELAVARERIINLDYDRANIEGQRDDAEARAVRAEAVVEAAREYMEDQSADWIENGDPSDPDEAIPPWQGSLSPLSKALAAFYAEEMGNAMRAALTEPGERYCEIAANRCAQEVMELTA